MAESDSGKGLLKGMFSGIFLAQLVLVLHALILLGIGFIVLFFRGILEYMPWIFAIGTLTILATGGYVFWRIRRSRGQLREALSNVDLRGRSVEISFLGGLASFKVGAPGQSSQGSFIELNDGDAPLLIEDSRGRRVQHMEKLASMLEAGLLTREEFDRLKSSLFEEENG